MRLPAPAAYAISAALHAVALGAVLRAPPPARTAADEVAIEVVEVAPSPPPPPRVVNAPRQTTGQITLLWLRKNTERREIAQFYDAPHTF